MKKRVLSLLTAAMMSGTCFFVGAEQICAAEYPSFTLRLNQHTRNAEFMEEETHKKVIFTATCLKYSGSDVELVDAKTNEVVATTLDDVVVKVDRTTVRIDEENQFVLFTTSPVDDYEGISVSLMDGITGEKVADLYDDGGLQGINDGDIYMNDSCYSNYLNFSDKKIGDYSYYIQYTDVNGTECKSENVTIHVYRGFTEQELADMSKVDNAISELCNSSEFKAMGTEERLNAAKTLLTSLESEGLVHAIILCKNQIEFQYSPGVQGAILPSVFVDDDTSAERMAEIAQKVGVLSSDTAFQNADQETRKQMADALFDQLIAEGYVKENSVNYDAEKHWYAYQCEGVGGFSDVTCYLDIAVKDPDQVSTGIATATSAFTYVNHGDSIEITGFDNSVSDVVIPSEIEGLPVTAISVGAFYLSTITSIEVPDSVTSIGEMAFLGCTSLKSVKLSTGVAKIDKNAFGSCSALQEIQVAKDNPNFSSLNGVLYSKKQDTLVIYPAAKTDAAYIIPSGVTSVAMYAFSENPYLETLTIPNSLIKVGDSAFYNCKNLRAVSYNGTEEEWNQITIGLLNEKLTGATIQYQERIIGDVNADGAFTVSDVVLLQKWLLSVPDTQLADWKAADFNGDQTLNVFDLCQMRYNLLKQEEDSKR